MSDRVIELRKYIGRDYDSYNCLDLVREFYKDHYNLELKDYYEGSTPERNEAASLIVSNKGDFVEVSDPQFGDIVVIKLHGMECHLGVYIENGRFLHSARTIGSLLDRTERYSKMIAGYYRHRSTK